MRQLYHTPLSPFCRKVRLALREKGLEFALAEENPWDKSLGFFALNPAGEVPVLVEDGTGIISGAYAIVEYLEDVYPDVPLFGRTPVQRAEARRIVGWFDHKFDYEVTQKILFEKVFKRMMYGGAPDSSVIRTGKENILYHLEYIGALSAERYFLAGDHLSMADLAAAAHLSALDYFGDVPWEHSPAAASWYALIKSRPSMRSILIDRAHGLRPPVYYEDPDF